MRFYLKITFFVWLSLIAIFSVIPHSDLDIVASKPFELSPSGFLKHVMAYTIAALIGCMAFGVSVRSLSALALFLTLFGSALELVQLGLPYRVFNSQDLLANLAGIFLGMAVFAVVAPTAVRIRLPVFRR